jgi:hypothetical protein
MTRVSTSQKSHFLQLVTESDFTEIEYLLGANDGRLSTLLTMSVKAQPCAQTPFRSAVNSISVG